MNASKKTPSQAPNSWSFAIEVARGIFGLINSGRIYPAFGLLLLSLSGLVIWRLPEADLARVTIAFLDVLAGSTGLAYVLFAASNIAWYLLFQKQKRIYDKEIDRLAAIRKDLFHLGVNQVLIENHRSSDGEQKESYIIPAVTDKDKTRK